MSDHRTSSSVTEYSFGPFTLAGPAWELLRNGKAVGLPVQSSKILQLLVSNAGQLLTREDICKAVWSDRYVDFEAGLNSEIKKIRRALGDNITEPHFIETVPRRGYRFVAQVNTPDAMPDKKQRFAAFVIVGIILIGLAGAYYVWPPQDADHSSDRDRSESASAAKLQSPAYDAHFKGLVALQRGDVDVAAELFSAAMDADPGYAPAYIGAARVNVRRRNEGWFRIETARRFAEKALELEPANGEAATIKAGLLLYYYRDHAASTSMVDTLLAAGVNTSGLHVAHAFLLMIAGNREASLTSVGKAYASDPMSPTLNANYGWIFYKAGSLENAERLCKTSHDLGPESVFALNCVIHVNHSQKDYAEAAEYDTRLMKLRGASDAEINAVRSVELAYAREQAYWRWTLAWLKDNKSSTLDGLSSMGIAHTILGQQTAAVAAFDAAFERGGEAFLAFLAIDPRVNELRSHPAFTRLAARSRIPQLATGTMP